MFFDVDDDDALPLPAKTNGKVHRALYGGGVMCESSVNDEHRKNLTKTYDDESVTCKACLRRMGA